MTNYSERLDKILGEFVDGCDCRIDEGQAYLHQSEFAADEAKQAIFDWHNKQIEALLDRLELSMRGKTIVDTAEGWQKFVKCHVVASIEAERNKLKEQL